MNEYDYPSEAVFYQTEIKKSTFIVHLAHTPDIASANAFIKEINHKYADARHNCWAYVAGDPTSPHVLGFSDDGEPNGTAGKPMLNVLVGSGLGEITAIVTRYFGGIKLGTGGLVRAYGGSVNDALRLLKTERKVPQATLLGCSSYAQQGAIEQLLATQFNALAVDKTFTNDVSWQITLDARQAKQAIAAIYELTHGEVELKIKQ